MRLGDNWVCPYCRRAQVLSQKRFDEPPTRLFVDNTTFERPTIVHQAIVCSYNNCRKLSLRSWLGPAFYDADRNLMGVSELVNEWALLPPSTAKPQPDYIPQALRDDYAEACAIRDLSPKASATLIRRCLRGMIRDFCGISKDRLFDEITELRDRVKSGKAPSGVEGDVADAIDHVRSIGNIGAHMEKNIDVIVDVDPGEAQTLIELVELLFVRRHGKLTP